MDKRTVLKLVRAFAEKVKKDSDVQQIILFGSHAKGTADDSSDIDVAVVTDRPLTNWLDESSRLFKLRRDINLSIEPVLIEARRDRSGFLEEIRRSGEMIYDRGRQE